MIARAVRTPGVALLREPFRWCTYFFVVGALVFASTGRAATIDSTRHFVVSPTSTRLAAAPKPLDRAAAGVNADTWMPREGTPGFALFAEAVEMARKNPREAVSKFADAAAKSPGFYAALFNAGAAASAAGDLSAAERYYRQALAVRPDYGPALTNLSLLMSEAGREEDAQRLVDEAAARYPDRAGPHVARAARAIARGALSRAEEEARSAMRLDERNVAAILVMARVFHAQGRLDSARFALDNALALEPGNALLHVELAGVLLEQNETSLALVAYERAARLRPTLASAQEGYGQLLLSRGMDADARAAFEQLVKLTPRSGGAQLLLGNALRAQRLYRDAERAYTRALALDPTLNQAHFNLGLLYIDNPIGGEDLERFERGLQELRAFVETAKLSRDNAAAVTRATEYIGATERRIQRETARQAREKRRQQQERSK